ncbi:hypothetical protein [Maribacter sp. HTCC2170]|nr:hypothetical protein [Maribacter sp. HTCC2170]EAR00796.1 hypothetical protein FB2170_16966 [Maribacter sp. HTCC2170]
MGWLLNSNEIMFSFNFGGIVRRISQPSNYNMAAMDRNFEELPIFAN